MKTSSQICESLAKKMVICPFFSTVNRTRNNEIIARKTAINNCKNLPMYKDACLNDYL